MTAPVLAPALPVVPVTPPPARPALYGLLQAANVVPLTGPAATQAGIYGVDWEPPPCTPALFWPADCAPAAAPAGGKTFNPRPARGSAAPFVVYWGEKCASVGIDLSQAGQRARAGLTQGEGRAVEAALWTLLTGAAGSPDPDLAAEDLGDARGVVDTLGHIEEELGNRLGVAGYVHAPRRVAAHAAAAQLVRWDGQVPRTPAGNVWVFGGGYDAALSRSGTLPPDGVTLIGTGPLTVWRGDIFTPTDQAGALFDRTNNDTYALAERVYAVGWDCAAVAFDTPLSP